MKAKTTKKFLSALLLIFIFIPAFAKTVQVSPEWKYSVGDNAEWSEPSFNDADWQTISIPGNIVGDKNGFFWIRKSVEVPGELKGQKIFMELGCVTASMEIFVDGILVCHHGTISPKAHVSHVDNTVFDLSPSAFHDGKAQIAIRCKNNMSHAMFKTFNFCDESRFVTTKIWQSLLSTTVYYMMSAICIFLFFYFMAQFFFDKTDKSALFFSLTVFFITIYFFDMASEFVIMPYPLQLALSKVSLVYSVGFLAIFMLCFFKMKYKIFKWITYGVFALFTILYGISFKNAPLMDNIFTLSLLPIFAYIVYIYVILVKALKRKVKYSILMISGTTFAMIFALHDIFYQFVFRHPPFAWLQGFSFFFIDITMFIVLMLENINNKRSIKEYAVKAEEQKDKLNNIIQNAALLSRETMEIASALNESVTKVALAADESAQKAKEIGGVVQSQNASIKNTSSAVENLADSVCSVKNELKTEKQIVDTTVTETKNLVDGVNSVASVIETAANFSLSLGDVAKKSSGEIANLVQVMEEVKDNSKKILDIAKIVSDFSSKTNMLAMNASIEAAHSGIAGKGFSVIAHEIKDLATASGEQSDKINELVNAIDAQIGTGFELSKNVKVALEKVSIDANATSDKVSESVASMDVQRESGKHITEATGMMSESSLKVKTESDRQNEYSEQVSGNMKELSEASTLTSKAVEEIIQKNLLLSEQATSLRELAKHAKETASNLNALIQV